MILTWILYYLFVGFIVMNTAILVIANLTKSLQGIVWWKRMMLFAAVVATDGIYFWLLWPIVLVGPFVPRLDGMSK